MDGFLAALMCDNIYWFYADYSLTFTAEESFVWHRALYVLDDKSHGKIRICKG
jgi:hypothetical protein